MPATYEPIATYTAPSNVTGYTFSSIPSTYTDLKLVCRYRTTTTTPGLGITINGSGSSYYQKNVRARQTNGDVISTQRTNFGNIVINENGVSATFPTIFICEFMDYTNTSKKRNWFLYNMSPNASTMETMYGIGYNDGITAAISSIYIFNTVSNGFSQNSTFTLYGILKA